MTIEIIPVSSALGAEIKGIDASRNITHAEFASVLEAWHRYQVIVLRGQHLPEEHQQIEFARRFGDLAEIHVAELKGDHPAVMYIGNLKPEGKNPGALPLGEMQFHIDQCYKERPAKGTMLYSIEIPPSGGETLFVNGYSVYEALPEKVKSRINNLKAINVYDYGGAVTDRSNMVSPEQGIYYAHPIVRTHPATGRKSIFVNPLMTHHIEGIGEQESNELLELIFDTINRPEFMYEHHWRVGDLLLWDNRCVLHARRDFDPQQRRWMRRVTIVGEKPV